MQFDNKGRLTELQQFDKGVTGISYYDGNGHNNQVKQIKTPNDMALDYNYDPAGRLAKVNCDGMYELKFAYNSKGRLAKWAQTPALNSR